MIAHDEGKNFMTKVFKTNANLIHVETKPILVESPNSMTIVERYHEPLRWEYKIIRAGAPS